MCYKSPGPRCQNSYDKAYKESKSSMYDALADKYEASDRANDAFESMLGASRKENLTEAEIEAGVQEMQTSQVDLGKAEDAYYEKIKAFEAVQAKVDATSGGLEKLQSKMDEFGDIFEVMDLDGSEKAAYDKLVSRYNAGNALYTSQLDAYDKINGTVSGRKPSRHFLNADQQKLEKSLRKVQAAVKSAQTDMDRAEKNLDYRNYPAQQDTLDSLTKREKSLQSSLDHAKETAKRVSKREASVNLPEDAWKREQAWYEGEQLKAATTGNTEWAKHLYTESVRCQRMAALAKKGHKENIPALVGEDGKPVGFALAFDSPTKEWSWSNGETKVPVVSTDHNTVVEIPGHGSFKVNKKASVPAYIDIELRKNGEETTMMKPDLRQIVQDPSTVKV